MSVLNNKEVEKGVYEYKKENYKKAKKIFRVILDLEPLHPEANYYLGLISLFHNDIVQAKFFFEVAFKTIPSCEKYFLSYADIIIKDKQYFNTIIFLDKSLKKDTATNEKLIALKDNLYSIIKKNALSKDDDINLFGLPNKLKENQKRLIQYFNKKKYEKAEKLALLFILKYPNNQVGWDIIGIIYALYGKLSESVYASYKSIEINPNDPNAYSNLANTLRQLGKLEEAKKYCKKAIILNPKLAAAHSNLGGILKEQGNFEKAIHSYKQSLLLNPNFPETYTNLGNIFKELGKLNEAEIYCKKAVNLNPFFAEGYYNLGIILKEIEKYDEAEISFKSCIKLNPKFIESYIYLSDCLFKLSRLDEAKKICKKSIMLNPALYVSYYILGNIYLELGKHQKAEKNFKKSITIKNDFVDPYFSLCFLYQRLNRFSEGLNIIFTAKQNLKKEIHDFLFYEAYFLYNQKNFVKVRQLFAKINQKKLTHKVAINYMKLKANFLDDEKKFSQSFNLFEKMNKKIKKSKEYNHEKAKKYFNIIKEKSLLLDDLEKNCKFLNNSAFSKKPIFLIGFPRSGTTLLDTILRSHSKINVIEEKPMIDKCRFFLDEEIDLLGIERLDDMTTNKLRNIYLSEIKKFQSSNCNKIIIDKLPLNILNLTLINKIFPNAKFILSVRHPYDCILSCWKQNFRLNDAMSNMCEINKIVEFYCFTMNIFQKSRIRYDLDLKEIRYEDLIKNFKQEITNLLKFLELQWEDQLVNFQKTAIERGIINTPSYSQVVKPIYQKSKYKWKNYKNYLLKYDKQIKPWIKFFHY